MGRNEARTERDALAQRVERMQRAEITRLAGEHLAVGEDIFVNGNATESYLTYTGEVDVDRVREDAKILLGERPGLRRQSPAFDPTQGTGGNPPGKSTPSFSDLLK